MKTLLASAVMMIATTGVAAAGEPDLPSGRHALVQTRVFAGYDRYPGDVHGASGGLSARLLLGRFVGYAAGLDADAGATGEGAVYRAELLPLGVGLRLGNASAITLAAGIGVGGARGGVMKTAMQIPVELRGRAQWGPVRATAWGSVRAVPLTDSRDTEIEAAVALGWGRQDSYWHRASAGSGPYAAFAVRHAGDAEVYTLALGFEIVGAN